MIRRQEKTNSNMKITIKCLCSELCLKTTKTKKHFETKQDCKSLLLLFMHLQDVQFRRILIHFTVWIWRMNMMKLSLFRDVLHPSVLFPVLQCVWLGRPQSDRSVYVGKKRSCVLLCLKNSVWTVKSLLCIRSSLGHYIYCFSNCTTFFFPNVLIAKCLYASFNLIFSDSKLWLKCSKRLRLLYIQISADEVRF